MHYQSHDKSFKFIVYLISIFITSCRSYRNICAMCTLLCIRDTHICVGRVAAAVSKNITASIYSYYAFLKCERMVVSKELVKATAVLPHSWHEASCVY